MRKAFTLIELLVVIAIIAILAAILFPVFAQAKEAAKKTQTISNTKNMGTATVIYSADSDDLFPLASSFDSATNTWRWNFIIRVPAGWTGGVQNTEPRKTQDSAHWGNSVYSYAKNYGIYAAAGAKDTTVVAVATPVVQPAKINLSYNGFLHGYSGTAAASPATLPLLYTASGKQNLVGFALSNPTLRCDQASPACAYNPGRHPQTGAVGTGGAMFYIQGCSGVAGDANGPSHKVHNDDSVYVYSDSHVKTGKMGMQGGPGALSGTAPDTDYRTDPNTQYFPGGKCSQSYWWDGSHAWLFRPDYQP
jgi:prepilin-type N-terminal cleavage/methylation domain-containing protein